MLVCVCVKERDVPRVACQYHVLEWPFEASLPTHAHTHSELSSLSLFVVFSSLTQTSRHQVLTHSLEPNTTLSSYLSPVFTYACSAFHALECSVFFSLIPDRDVSPDPLPLVFFRLSLSPVYLSLSHSAASSYPLCLSLSHTHITHTTYHIETPL